MGDIADDMMDGLICQECGAFMGDYVGYPRTCGACSNASPVKARSAKPYQCKHCGKRFSTEQGYKDHTLARHTK